MKVEEMLRYKRKIEEQINEMKQFLDMQTQLNTEDSDPQKWQVLCPRETTRKTQAEIDIEKLNKERDILDVIEQDVNRTMQEFPFFNDPLIKTTFKNMLYMWTMDNTDIGYGQGMHEILAMFIFAFFQEALQLKDGESEDSRVTVDQDYEENAIM